jgi:DNA-directed RNA polymerase subunit K/omega
MLVIYRPRWLGAFEFAVLASQRAVQLRRGCVPKLEGDHKFEVTAQLEVLAGKVVRSVERTGDSSSAGGQSAAADVAVCPEELRHLEPPRTITASPVEPALSDMALSGRRDAP